MAKYTVHHVCGHSSEAQIYGPEADRPAKQRRLGEGLCPECYAKQRAEANVAAAESNAEAGLPTLRGSLKQVAWAESIRGAALDSMIAAGAGERMATAIVASQTAATWWIDNRSINTPKEWTMQLCLAAGWIDAAGRMTEAGRKARATMTD